MTASFSEQLASLAEQPIQPAWRRLVQGRRCLVYGVGRTGGGLLTAVVLKRHGAQVRFYDDVPRSAHSFGRYSAKIPWYTAASLRAARQWSELVVPAPGVPRRRLRLWGRQQRLTPEGLFLLGHGGQRVAVSGSKGKSTVCALTAQMLQWPVTGNTFGHLLTAFAEFGPAASLVCEWSSFQLDHWRSSGLYRPGCRIAEVGALTNVLSDHLDWHGSQQAYEAAKAILPAHCTAALPSEPMVFWQDGMLWCGDEALVSLDAFQLFGAHNRQNAVLATRLALAAGADLKAIRQALHDFQGLPHRLQRMTSPWRHTTVINDSQGTTPAAAAAAVRAIAEQSLGKLFLLLGGVDKGGDRAELQQALLEFPRPYAVGCFGQSRDSWLAWGLQLTDSFFATATMHEALAMCPYAESEQRVVLLSPACASHDQFSNYEERGRAFASALVDLA